MPCSEWDSNPHDLSVANFAGWRVYQIPPSEHALRFRAGHPCAATHVLQRAEGEEGGVGRVVLFIPASPLDFALLRQGSSGG